MDAVARATAIYVIVLLLLRAAGKRSLGEMTTFDFVLLLIVAEATQQAMLGDDFSVTNALLVVSTLVALDIGLSHLKRRYPRLDRAIDSAPVIVLEDGKPISQRMSKARIDEYDILAAARHSQGLERLDQIKYAVLEKSGGISVIPKSDREISA